MLTYLGALLTTLLAARRDERGASAVEYGLLAAGVILLALGAWEMLEHTVIAEFKRQDSIVRDG